MRTDDEPRAALDEGYRLDDQVGFKLRLAYQRHAAIFASRIPDGLTPTQWAALARLAECGPLSQAGLGRLTAMDSATIKGVVDRLAARGLVSSQADPEDGRRVIVALTADGADLVERAAPMAAAISAETLQALTAPEARTLLALLDRLC